MSGQTLRQKRADGYFYIAPGPFCGGRAELRHRKTIWVECTKCSAVRWGKTEKAAVMGWNGRVI